MPLHPTGSDVLLALLKDVRFTSMPEENRVVLVNYILAAPEAIGTELLNTKVSPLSLLQAKIAFLEYCLKNGLVEKSATLIIDSYKKSGSKFLSKRIKDLLPELPSADKLAEQVEKALKALIKLYNDGIANFPKNLQDELAAKVFFLMKFGLAEKVARQCLAENLTIADLLLLEPAAVLINSKQKNK